MKLIRFVLSLFAVFFFILLLATSTLYFQLLNKNFILDALRKPAVYETTQKGLKTLVKDLIYNGIKSENETYDKLSDTQKQLLDNEINTTLNFINVANVTDFMEVNTTRVLDYANGQNQTLLIYLPVEKWNLPVQISSQIPDIYKTENIDIVALVDAGKIKIDIAGIENMRHWNSNAKKSWLINLILFLTSITTVALIDIKSQQPKKTANLVMLLGVLTLLLAIGLNLAKNAINFGIPPQAASLTLILSALIPAIFSGILVFWATIGIALLIVGLTFYAIPKRQNHNSKNTV